MNKYAKQARLARKRKQSQKLSCSAKRAFPSKEEASIKGMRSYQCKQCGQWHRTSRYTWNGRSL